MDSEQQTTPIVEAWLKDTSDTPYGTEMGVGRVKSRVRQTRQRGRWWPLPSFPRTPAPAPDIPTTEFPPTPTSNSHAPTATGRTMPMFSATKFVIVGAIVALAGGLLLIAQPFEQQGEGAPGAVTGGPGTFSPAGTLDEARSYHTATPLDDGRVLVVGGITEPWNIAATAEVWDPATASFRPAGSLAEARSGHTATLLDDGRVLIVGGGGSDGNAVTAEVWDPVTASFEAAGLLTEGRGEMHTATLLDDGRVLVVGGLRQYGVSLAEGAEVWDPVTASFGPAASLDGTRAGHTATLLPDGRVLLVGGEGYDSSTDTGFEPPAQMWDPVTASLEPAGSLTEGREEHTATLLPDGRVLIVGGSDGSNTPSYGTKRSSAEVWDPVTATFSPAGSLAQARHRHTAALLPDGRVLIVGGEYWDPDGGYGVATAEVWDPVTATFSPAGSLAEERSGDSGTLLGDGRVLIVGGHQGDDDLLATAEVWEPSDR